MADRTFYPERGTLRRGKVTLHGRVTTTTGGTIGSQTGGKQAGFTVARANTGLYTITLQDRYSELLNVNVSILGANATYTAAAGREYYLRNDNVAAAAKTLQVQFLRTDTGAVADVEDAARILITLELANSSV